jgi:hypothetical protein
METMRAYNSGYTDMKRQTPMDDSISMSQRQEEGVRPQMEEVPAELRTYSRNAGEADDL